MNRECEVRLVSSYIYLENLRLRAYHGVLPQERLTGNDYVVNVRARYDIGNAMRSDDVDDTLNYAAAYEVIRQAMAVRANLLERVCANIGERLMREFPQIAAVDLRVTKVNPPMGADCDGAGVEAHFEREE